MRRSALLILLAVLAVAVAVPTSIAGAAAPDAQTAAKAKKKAGKKKAGKCKTAKKKGKAKSKGKARKSLTADSAAKGKGKAKGKKKAKKNCGKAKKKAPKRPKRVRSPYEQKLIEHFRKRAEERPKPVKPPTIEDMVPADGTYTSAAAPGLTVTISGKSTNARVVYTVPKAQYSPNCQAHIAGDGVAVDISGPLTPSQSTKRGYLQLYKSQGNDSWSVNGSIGKDGSFTFTVDASFAYPPDPNATCSGYLPLAGTLVK